MEEQLEIDSNKYLIEKCEENNNLIYLENSYGENGNVLYFEYLNGECCKIQYDSNKNVIYLENSKDGVLIDKRTKKLKK